MDYSKPETWDWDALCRAENYAVVVVNDDDWEGLYIGGLLRFEHHHVEFFTLNDECAALELASIMMPIYTAYVDGIAQSTGGMPQRLFDVKRYIDNPDAGDEGDADDV